MPEITVDANQRGHVVVDISWWSAVRALEQMSTKYPIERLSLVMADELYGIANTVLQRLRERELAEINNNKG